MIQPYPVVRRNPPRPSRLFMDWVAEYGPVRLSRSLGVSRSSVHAWVTETGWRRRPRLETVFDIIALSRIEPLRGEKILTISDIVGDIRINRMEVRGSPETP